MGSASAIDELRSRIRAIEGARAVTRRFPTGLSAIDNLIEGLPRPGLVEVCGAPGTGRTRLVLGLIKRLQGAAWLDFTRQLYPPALAACGIDLRSLFLVHPPADRGIWTVEQVVRAGCFPVVVVSDPPPLRRAGHRWGRAAESGRCTLIIITERHRRDFPADVRLSAAHNQLTTVRNRGGALGRTTELPPPDCGIDPW